MKKVMSIAAIALFIAGSSAFACDTCGCKDKKADDKKPACSAKKCPDCKPGEPCKACAEKCEAAKKCPNCKPDEPCKACVKKAEECAKKCPAEKE